MPRNKGWFRVYDRMIDSPEVVQLSDSEFRLLVSMWCLASASGSEEGAVPFNVTSLRRRAMPDHSEEEVSAMLQHLQSLDLIREADGHFVVQRWAEHQYQFESKRPSNRRQREGMGKSSGSSGEAFGQTDTDTDSDTESDSEEERGVNAATPCGSQANLTAHEDEGESKAPEPSPDVTPAERELMAVLKAIPGYPFDYATDLRKVREWAVDFPAVDLIREAKSWSDWLSNPRNKVKNYRLAFRHWLEVASKPRARGTGPPQRTQARAEPKAWATLRRMMAEEMRKEAEPDDPG